MIGHLLSVTALGGLMMATVACGGDASADEPPEIDYGSDICSRCHMIVSEDRHAAGLVGQDGETLIFDDTGEMVMTVQEQGLAQRRAWVHDYTTREWIDGTTAFFVDSHDIMTPMGTGVVAFAARTAAEAFADETNGRVMTWEETLADWKPHAHGH